MKVSDMIISFCQSILAGLIAGLVVSLYGGMNSKFILIYLGIVVLLTVFAFVYQAHWERKE